MTERKRPGGELASRPLHFIWILDCSGSMAGEKIQQLNTAIKESLPHMREVANGNPNARVLLRVLTFSSGARWHTANPTPLEDFKWFDVSVDGVTDMGKALRMVAEQLQMPPMEKRALPPVLVLISDGLPTDDYKGGLKALKEQPWGQKAVRVAIAIGRDADTDVLAQFIDHPEIKPLVANNADQLVQYIRWASTEVLKQASSPASQDAAQGGAGLIVPIPTAQDGAGASAATPTDDVW
jgi:uncharacterized protein YegL